MKRVLLLASLVFGGAHGAQNINADLIPNLGEKTAYEIRVAKKINPHLQKISETSLAQHIDVKGFNEAAKRCAKSLSEKAYYKCRGEFDAEYLSKNFASAAENLDWFSGSKNSTVCKNILDKKLFLSQSGKLEIALGDSVIKTDSLRASYSHNLSISKKGKEQNVYYYPMYELTAQLEFFAHEGNVYLNLFDDDGYAIYEYDADVRFFESKCFIKATLIGNKNTIKQNDKICQKVLEDNFTKPSSVKMQEILPQNEFEENFFADPIDEEVTHIERNHNLDDASCVGYAYYVDMYNNGEKHAFIKLYSPSTLEYDFYAQYLPKTEERFAPILPAENGEYSVVSDTGGEEQIVFIDGKTYILTKTWLRATGLYDMKERGKAEKICDFEPSYRYE